MPYLDGSRYLNEQGSSSSGSGSTITIIDDSDYTLDSSGEKIISVTSNGDDGSITITPYTLLEDGSLFVYARTSTEVTIRSTSGSIHNGVEFHFKLEVIS
jgi:hypothetical protein